MATATKEKPAKKAAKKKADDKPSALQKAINEVRAFAGPRAIIPASQMPELQRVSFGSLTLDIISEGGLPLGRFITIVGMESCAKSSLIYRLMGNFLGQGMATILFDAERNYIPSWGERLGLYESEREKKWWRILPDDMESSYDQAEHIMRSGECAAVFIDSIAILNPGADMVGEKAKSVADAKNPQRAKFTNEFIRRATAAQCWCENRRLVVPTIVLVQQYYTNVKMSAYQAGPNKIKPGGVQQNFANTLEIDLRRGEIKTEKIAASAVETDGATAADDGDEKKKKKVEEIPVAVEITATAKKNKAGAPYGEGTFWFYFRDRRDGMYPVGVCVADEVVRYGVKHKIIELEGATYSYAPRGLRAVGIKRLEYELAVGEWKPYLPEIYNATLAAVLAGKKLTEVVT